VVRGGGELASAAARLLFLSGMRVVVLEREKPLAVRRLVSFADAVFSGERSVEGVKGRLVAGDAVPGGALSYVPVVVDPEGRLLARWAPEVVVDARMTKQPSAERGGGSALRIGLGPGFTAGVEVDAVVETQRGPDLGRVIWRGAAEPDTSVPTAVLGYTEKRVLRAPRAGTFRQRIALGAVVIPGDVIGDVDGEPVATPIAGLLRGVLEDGVPVEAGIKVGDVDPRGPGVNAAVISDKARAVAAGVLEAVLLRRHGLR
jgi:xanthine dehydrogenase accessory factor